MVCTMNKTRFEDPVHDPVAVHDPDRCVRDCLSVTCASVGGLWDTVAGTYFPNANPCGGVAICLAGQTGTECQTCGPGFYYSSENVC